MQDLKSSADLYRWYVERALEHPAIVGTHYFQLYDQPLTGRGDGENYRIGFLDIVDQPYPEMIEASRSIAETLYQRRSTKAGDR